jgi:REase_AHJR-like
MDIEPRIQEVARQYRNEGYAVVVHPQGEDVPPFAAGLPVDLIARRPDENVIVGVYENRDAVAKKPELQRLADRTDAQPGWRFDLVVLEPVNPMERILSSAREPSDEQLAGLLTKAEVVLNAGDLESACVYAWAGLEAVMRRVRSGAERNGTAAPSELLATLYSHGFLSREEFSNLRESFQVRTQLVHGLVPTRIDPAMVRDAITVARKLLGTGEQAEAPAAS